MNDVIYQYDGSLDGFLCCVYESYVYKEAPAAFCCDEDPLSLYEVRTVITQPAYSQRVSRGIAARSGKALAVVRRGFLTGLPDKELHLSLIHISAKAPSTASYIQLQAGETVEHLSLIHISQYAAGEEQTFYVIPPKEADGQFRQFTGRESGAARIIAAPVDAVDRKSTRLNSSHITRYRMPSSA